ncbi:MAG TPA: AbrB/MazE/SpoVT family DNA-binding domain-containing protein [Verrucomicrobiae bacterium]|jgi:AbrB family looped-hinge helix DNA binding protein|nr:AbrB/MazE/SpoVT family DNA-binding domain-containing protein [Verrucomicrobiae bacterium]
MAMTTTVGDSNQVSIPPDIAQKCDIHPGTQLEWVMAADGSIMVKPLRSRGELARQLLGAGRHWLKPGADPIGDFIQDRQEDDKLDRADEQ